MSEISGWGQLSLTCSQWAGDITCWKGSPLDPTALAATCSQFAIPGPSARHLHSLGKVTLPHELEGDTVPVFDATCSLMGILHIWHMMTWGGTTGAEGRV